MVILKSEGAYTMDELMTKEHTSKQTGIGVIDCDVHNGARCRSAGLILVIKS